jgi:hypothetical protein
MNRKLDLFLLSIVEWCQRHEVEIFFAILAIMLVAFLFLPVLFPPKL